MPIDAVLPAFLIAALGYSLGKKLQLDVKTLSRICLYVLAPSLAFNSLATSTIDIAVAWRLIVASLVFPFIEIGLFIGLFKALRWDRDTSRAMLLASIFTNAGNYGLPVCLFAFGQQGMDLGVVFMVSQTVMINTLGVYIAASAQGSAGSAMKQVLKMPAVYAAVAGVLMKVFGLPLPAIIGRPIGLLAQAAVPVFLLLLGVQLIGSAEGAKSWKEPLVVVPLRLIVAPVIAGAIGYLVGLNGLAWKVLVLQGAMSTPVNATVLAQEFGAEPAMVSKVTATTTVISVLTLTLWIMALQAIG